MNESSYIWVAIATCLLICPLTIAIYAQVKKKQVGILWFCVAFALNLALLLAFDKPTEDELRTYNRVEILHRGNMKALGEAILNPLIVGAICFTILVTLPRRSRDAKG